LLDYRLSPIRLLPLSSTTFTQFVNEEG
jgi:hypothetical protein